MELETRRIRGLEMKKTVVDQFYIDEEFNVPDSKEAVSYTHLDVYKRQFLSFALTDAPAVVRQDVTAVFFQL